MQRRQEEYIKFGILIALEDGTSQRFGDLVDPTLRTSDSDFRYLFLKPAWSLH